VTDTLKIAELARSLWHSRTTCFLVLLQLRYWSSGVLRTVMCNTCKCT